MTRSVNRKDDDERLPSNGMDRNELTGCVPHIPRQLTSVPRGTRAMMVVSYKSAEGRLRVPSK